jgi:transcriptional regulator with XRE-family HTH domain
MTSTNQAGSIRDRRKAAGLSQQRLAELAGCSLSAVYLLEKGFSPAHSAPREKVERVLACFDDRTPKRA